MKYFEKKLIMGSAITKSNSSNVLNLRNLRTAAKVYSFPNRFARLPTMVIFEEYIEYIHIEYRSIYVPEIITNIFITKTKTTCKNNAKTHIILIFLV